MGNPGGDQGDGTVMIPRCPKCHEVFYDLSAMEAHIRMENEKSGQTSGLRDILRSKL